MSKISALKVFSLFGKKSRAGGSSPRERTGPKMPGGTPKLNQPEPPPWEKIFDRLATMDLNNAKGFETVTNKVLKLSEDFTTMQATQVTLQKDVGAVKAEAAELREEMVAMSQRVDDTNKRLDELKESTDSRFRELEVALLTKARSLPVQFPSLSASQQLTINERFESLRVQAKLCRNIFVLGHVPDYGQPAPLKSVIANFFPKCEVKLLPKAGKANVWRISVPMGKEDMTKKIADANVFGIRDHGWWIQQDLPPKLREMHSNAYTFIKLAKDRFRRLRPFVFVADDGYLVVEKTPLVPVYLIPKKKDKWGDLATVLASEIGGKVDTEWLESVVTSNVNVASLVEKWSEVLGVQVTCAESELQEDTMENMNEGGG